MQLSKTVTRVPLCMGVVLTAVLLCSCATQSGRSIRQQTGETLVLAGEEPAALAYVPATRQALRVRSTYLPGSGTIEYLQDRDYGFDPVRGTVWRTANSRIPDFRTNILYGQLDFDHTRFPGFGNTPFFVYLDYSYRASEPWPKQPKQAGLLSTTRAKLTSGKPVKIVAYGDSITAGGDATRPELIFWQRWAQELRTKYPRATITAVNGATGGDSTVQGLQRLKSKVLDESPDLVLIGFGMNDHNKGGVPVPAFSENLRQMIGQIRSATGAEIVLFSAFPPNPHWKFGTQRMTEYAMATARVAEEVHCAYADVYNNWQALASHKKPEDLLGNNINHPNDFGHWIYYRVLSGMGL